jgi:hypothetical protein
MKMPSSFIKEGAQNRQSPSGHLPMKETTAWGAQTVRPHLPLERSQVMSLLHAALAQGEARFARQVALAWLTAFPGDLPMSLLHAQALMQGDLPVQAASKQAASLLERICNADPEFIDAQETLRKARQQAGLADSPDNSGDILVLGGHSLPGSPDIPWAPLLRQARQALLHAQSVGPGLAERLVHQALVIEPPTPLAGILHLKAAILSGLPGPSISSLAEMYLGRWPECIQLKLFLAETLTDSGSADRAVELLHQAAAQDITGQVPTRLWGANHPYKTLWPDRLEAPILQDLAIPASVAAAMGWNRLPSGYEEARTGSAGGVPVQEEDELIVEAEYSLDSAVQNEKELLAELWSRTPVETDTDVEFSEAGAVDAANPVPESLRSVQKELEKVATHIKKPQLAHIDGRFPVYVVLTTRSGLEKQYGKAGAVQVEEAIRGLVGAVRSRKNWSSLFYYADDPESTLGAALQPYKPKPARPGDPWSLKLALTDLDYALRKQGEMIGAVLIVGGPEVVPFHRLPNPVDDDDVDVPSDNPYSTRDENYFIPEWPVGRLPGGCGSNPDLLLRLIKGLSAHHTEMAQSVPWYRSWWQWLVARVWPVITREKPGLGYTAAIWRRASLSVFRPIGEANAMLVSPPVHVGNGSKPAGEAPPNLGEIWESEQINANGNNGSLVLHPAKMGYFNLHGLVDSVEWYGQSDPFLASDGPEYPVALRPVDVAAHRDNGYRIPQVVFSEACYGAHIEGRQVDHSIALQFLSKGSQAVAGSTVTAYGAVNSPLTAADLLGYSFWTYISEGLPAGEALRRAKIRLAREMHRRQGYLDGEDQKTLISFVLYGDPLSQPVLTGRSSKSILRPQQSPSNVRLVCDRSDDASGSRPVPGEVVAYVKHIVEQYLPGMDGADLSMSLEHAGCSGTGHLCPTAQMGAKSNPSSPAGRRVVRLSKQVHKANSTHTHYARLTLDPQGKLVKLVVSR